MNIEPKVVRTRAKDTCLVVRVSPETKKKLVKMAKANGVSVIRVVEALVNSAG